MAIAKSYGLNWNSYTWFSPVGGEGWGMGGTFGWLVVKWLSQLQLCLTKVASWQGRRDLELEVPVECAVFLMGL